MHHHYIMNDQRTWCTQVSTYENDMFIMLDVLIYYFNRLKASATNEQVL